MPEAELPPGARPPAVPAGATGARIEGLRLEGGALAVKIERGLRAAQVRIAGAGAVAADAGLAVRLDYALPLPVTIGSLADLWSVVQGPDPRLAQGHCAGAAWLWAHRRERTRHRHRRTTWAGHALCARSASRELHWRRVRAPPFTRQREKKELMSSTEGTRSWKYLRRNPGYIAAWRTAAQPAAEEPAPFPLRGQTAADREAAAWGLLAWEDPADEAGPASPFWTDAPMLEAVPSPEAPALAELLKEPEVRLSGLRLEGGAAILKVERGEGSVQVRVEDGARFDPAGGIALRLPMGLDLQVRLRRTAELWPFAGAGIKKEDAARGFRTRNC